MKCRVDYNSLMVRPLGPISIPYDNIPNWRRNICVIVGVVVGGHGRTSSRRGKYPSLWTGVPSWALLSKYSNLIRLVWIYSLSCRSNNSLHKLCGYRLIPAFPRVGRKECFFSQNHSWMGHFSVLFFSWPTSSLDSGGNSSQIPLELVSRSLHRPFPSTVRTNES